MARTSSTPVAALAAESRPETGRLPTLWLLVISLRQEQWSKNLLLFAGLIFGGRLLETSAVLVAGAAFVIFCALSSSVYLFNDVWDQDADRHHPLKQTRPIASGDLTTPVALSVASVLAVVAVAAAFLISVPLGAVATGYVLLLLLYSAALKHVVIIDVLTIAAGFVLRAIAGALAVNVPIGAWLLLCTTLLALFLALSKRRHELMLLGECAVDHRRILEEYSPYLLDQMIAVVTASTLIAYTLFATSADTAQRLGTSRLGLTIPFVLYGIFRYLYLVHQKRGGGSPASMLMTDRPLLACVVLWVGTVAVLMYLPLGR
ncbi:MAG: decaprenyl-phosphate phosphoribosyltransferase [Acidobacteria bacterium]|nr:decaprenyl-phosphate phosphoribosyltransferase [Acidobacteriota bacterium]